jgi:predicted kinase
MPCLKSLASWAPLLACSFFNMSLQTCLERNQHQARTHRIPEHMIAYQIQQVPQVLLSIPHEGWDQIHIFDEHFPAVEIDLLPS